MKKPPYRAYKKKTEREKPPIQIPEKIDTREAEQLVEDIYRLKNFFASHWKPITALLTAVVLIIGGFLGYKAYRSSIELKAARIVDEGLWNLRHNKKEEAIKLFKEAIREYPTAPSSKLATFLSDRLENSMNNLERFAKEKDFLLTPPSKTAIAAKEINTNKLQKAESILSNMKRDFDWTYPEAVYDKLLIGLKENNQKKIKEALNILEGDFSKYPITELARRLTE